MTPPVLVLLPGLDGTGRMFGPLESALHKSVATLVVRYPTDQPLAYEDLLPFVLEALPVDVPYILVAESFSGPLAILLAATTPKNLRALVLCSSFIRNPIRWFPKCLRFLARGPLFSIAPSLLIAEVLLAGYAPPDVVQLLKESLVTVAPTVMAARARAILAANVESQLKEVRVPIFFIRGLFDKLTPIGNLKDVQRVRPDTEVTTINGPHMILQTNPTEAAAVLTEITRKSGAF